MKEETMKKKRGRPKKVASAPAPEVENDFSESLSLTQIRDILLEFSNSMYWQAYKQYINHRMSVADGGLRSIDPFKNPTEMARQQGIRMGLNDLEDYINESKRKIAEAERGESGEEQYESPVL